MTVPPVDPNERLIGAREIRPLVLSFHRPERRTAPGFLELAR